MPQPVRRPSRRSFWTLLLLFGGMLACMLLAGELVYHRALRGEAESVQRQLSLYAQALGQRIDRYRTLPEVLALDAQLRAALTHPLSPAEVDALNRKLEQANGASQSSTLTLIDRHGTALAASNWRETRSNVGVDYSFRPYVQQALSRGSGRFYGIGLTTGVPGYFLSQAILDEHNAVAGLVVIKIALLELEREWLQTPDVVMASDEHGVVFLASQSDWRYRLLSPLSPADEADLAATRQYIDQELHPMRYRVRQGLEQGSRLVQMQEPALPGTTLWQTLPLPGSDWQLHLLHDTQASTVASRWAAAAAAGAGWPWACWCCSCASAGGWPRCACAAAWSWRPCCASMPRSCARPRTASSRPRARPTRTEPQPGAPAPGRGGDRCRPQPGGLELALRGAVPLSSELLRTGQPIENLFRYNARRGLLGPGPIEEAIHRRLQHLRSGSPHLRESTKDDGTVLEIRGNPLPDGGFVTSYADITSYKNAARELRSLADALEQRIAERTRDLAEAKREAEQANRYKTRFVAAAVHDLLQPLNAARMFSSLLRSHLHDEAGRHVADSIDGALAAQDAILGSLLDISRMESGQLEVRVRDFALGPLLQVMRHNFGILAESRGLRLSAVDTRCVVRSDEALLRRILQNFLSNAIRYTRQGRIVIGCRRQGQQLRIEVHDQGPGIPESLQHEIFEEFRRLDEGHGDDRGAGLGLAIVERLGRLLGHEIGLRSQLGRGSVFWVCVPLGDPGAVPQIAASAQTGDPDQDAPLQGMNAWYVEDDPQSCTAMRALLQRWGCSVPLAGGPAEALALAAPGEAPQLVLLDVRLGQLHGPDVYAQLCQRWGQSPPVILVTAERDGMLRRQAAERGWGFLAKPVRPPALRALMSQMLLRHR